MRVLFLGRFPNPIHGAALMNESYYNGLKEDKDFNIKKIKINYSDSLDELGKINLKKFFGFFIVFFKLLKELIFFQPKIIYFELAPKGFAFYRDSTYVLLCKIFRKKIIFHFHAKGVETLNKKTISRTYARFIFKNTKSILLSNLLYYDLKSFVDEKDIFILPNGIKDNLSDKEFEKIIQERKKNKKLQLLFLSNMIETKGPLDVLYICNELKKKKIEFECSFVGKFQDSNFEKKFFKELNSLNLERECKYLGPNYGKEKFKILERTNYLIFPTIEDVFPIVLLESFIYGIPVLSYNAGAIREIISNKKLGYVSKRRDWANLSKELIKRIKKTESSKEIREEFKKKYLLDKTLKDLKRTLKL